MTMRSLSSRTPTTLFALALGLALVVPEARSQPMPIDPRLPPPPRLNECLQIVQKGGVKIDLAATTTPNSVQITWQGYPGDYTVTSADDTGFNARVELRESRILKGGRNEPAPAPQLEQGTVMHAGARADFAYHYSIRGTLYDGRVACGGVSARTPPAPPIRSFARQPTGPLATAQDMKVFGTAITELPAPILLPAPGSYQTSCVNISQLQVRRQGSPWTMTTISAQCRKRDGTLVAARLNDPRNCGGDIWNDDGAFGCQRVQTVVLGRVMFPLPAGSWLQSCRDAYHHFESHEYRAQCRTGSGAWRYTSLNLSAFPCASVSNDDGWMSCDASPVPRGPWRAHCKEATIPQPGLGFTAICRRASDGVWQRTFVGQCGQDVDVLDGFLTCGLITGLPGGDWSTRCRPVNWDPAEPAITLICRNNDQTRVAWRVTIASCASPVQLNYDGANRFTC